MLVIKVEIWPGGDPNRAREIGRMGMANVSDLDETSDYIFVSQNDKGEVASGLVEKHERAAGFWQLLSRLTSVAAKSGNKIPKKHELTLKAIEARMSFKTSPTPLHVPESIGERDTP